MSYGIAGLLGEDPYLSTTETSDRARLTLTSIFTGSGLPATIASDSAYYVSSSAFWSQLTSSILDIGQFDITSKNIAGNKRWIKIDLAAKYYNTRFNSTASALGTAAQQAVNTVKPSDAFIATGIAITSQSVAPSATTGFQIVSNMAGAANPSAVSDGGDPPAEDSWLDFQLGNGEQVRIRANTNGWRDRTGDPAKTIYWTNLHHGSATDIRNNLSGAFASLTSSNGVPYYQVVGAFTGGSLVQLTASVTGSDFNFISPATIVGTGFVSGSTTFDGNQNYVASHYITGGVDHLPIVYYATRTNVNPSEQSVLTDGSRQKTIFTSRFYGGGGPEVMTEAFLDVYAKEKSVYSALPFRNLLVKNDSGEPAREIKFLDHYGVGLTQSMGPSIRVNSHANRREGLNTLHARHAGPAGLDSKHGSTGQTDFTEPSAGGTYEPSFHKVHRNTKIVPRLVSDSDTAAILVKKTNNFYLQTQIPASDYHYSWVTSSLGDNYSVSSGRQKVFGYWPKDGILIRDNKKGERGSYYATQITASTIESAIVFPTGSDIHGS